MGATASVTAQKNPNEAQINGQASTSQAVWDVSNLSTLVQSVRFIILAHSTKVGHGDCVDQLDSCTIKVTQLVEQFEWIIKHYNFKY